MEKTLKQLILNKCEEQRGLANDLAHIAGYATGGGFKKPLLKEEKEFEKFHGLIEVVRYLFPKEEVKLLSDFALTLDPNKQSARYMLEYLEQHRMTDVKRILIDKMLNCSNTESREWVTLYNLDDNYVMKKSSFIETFNEYGGFKPKTLEVEIGVKIFKGYCLLDEQMFGILDQSILGLDMEIMKISDAYIREMYYSRFMILSIASTVSKNRPEQARELCQKVLTNVQDYYYRSLACLHLGNTYLMESYDTANKIYTKGLEYANDSRCEFVQANLMRSLNFLDNLYGKQPRHLNLFSDHPADIHEIAFYYIKNKQYIKANEMLNKMDFESLNGVQKAFNHFYRGLIGKDAIKHFSRSIIYFKKAGEYFFRTFPLLELEKLGVDQNLIEALAV